MPRTPPPGFGSTDTGLTTSLNSLSTEQVARWADRIADGRDEFPVDLPEPDRSVLADAVRRCLRDRLLRLVARAIAERLARPDTAVTED